ncbi:MAG: Ycf48-like protein [Acidobacteria bacterium]|nr:Ycf48-like protein [Acidobacteriota bacterium]
MKRRVVEKVICSLLAIAFSVSSAWAQNRGFTIQVASPTSEAEARSVIADLQAKGVEAYWVKAEVPGKGVRYRVRIGRFKSQAEAKVMADRILGRGAIKEFLVTPYDAPPSDSVARAESKPAGKTPADTDRPSPVSEPVKEISKNEAQAKTAPATETANPNAEKSALASVDSISESKPEGKIAEAKPEIKADAAPTPPEKVAAEKVAGDPAKSDRTDKNSSQSAQLDSRLAHLANPPSHKALNANPAIATPAVADALADVTINNSAWKVVKRSVETDKNLRAIYFVDSMTGWAAGDAGVVYRTTDGGRNWKPLLSGAAANINFIYFIDWNHGWMIGESSGRMSDESEGENVLLLTTNGGRSWTRKSLPNVTSLYFTDSKTGWAVGRNATLLKTTDGGLEWSKVESAEKLIGLPIESSNYNFGFRDIHFPDAEHGWLIGNFYGRARSNIGGIFATSDGGLTWKRVPITFQTQYTSGRFTPGLLHSIRFTDANTGSVTGEMYDGEGRFFFVLHTRDAGKTWEQFRTPSRATHSTQFLDMYNGWTAAFAPREGGAEAVVYDTTLMRTDNGGMSWRNDFIARGRRIRSVFFLSPTKGWAVGDRGMILSYEEKSKAN